MKALFISSLIFITGLLACTKNAPDTDEKQLTGSWHLISTCCGIDYAGVPTDSIVLKFETSGKYYTTTNTTLTETGSYKLSEEKNNAGTDQTIISFSPHTGNSYATYMHLNNDTLVLIYTGISTDGISWSYKKLK